MPMSTARQLRLVAPTARRDYGIRGWQWRPDQPPQSFSHGGVHERCWLQRRGLMQIANAQGEHVFSTAADADGCGKLELANETGGVVFSANAVKNSGAVMACSTLLESLSSWAPSLKADC